MIIKKLTDWKLTGYHPYTPIWRRSFEIGISHGVVTPTIDAKVPGGVHDDLMRAGIIEDPYYEMNSLKCEWVPQRWWVYNTTCVIDGRFKGKRIRLTFLGIDYKAHIFFNEMPEIVHEGMYMHAVLDVTDFVAFGKENNIRVVLESAPDEMGQIGYTSQTHTQKSRFNYKWDFSTRIINLGLYDDVYIEALGDASIGDCHIRYKDEILTCDAEVEGDGEMRAVLSFEGVTLEEKTVKIEDRKSKAVFNIQDPKLWYPNGYGEQPLYDISLYLTDNNGFTHNKNFRYGLCERRFDRCDNASTDSLPYLVSINGVRIYIKGVNITPLDHIYGRVGRERYEKLIKLAKDAGVNLIRVWGGGIIEKEVFYDLCDQYGIMVWQEFIQSSSGIDSIPSEIPEFLELCAKTAETAVKEKRNHTCLTYWSGGNELLDGVDESGPRVPATYKNKNIAMLKKIVDKHDPDRLMLPTSASGPSFNIDPSRPKDNHDVHGPWKYAGTTKHYTLYNNSPCQLHSEFGIDGMSSIETLRSILSPKNQVVTTVLDNLVWRHHGEWWDTYSYRDKLLFGEMTSLETFIVISQYMQAEGLRYALEANRRRAFENCGSIVWQFNEPWPNVSCTSMLDYYMNPKLCYWFFRDAMKSFHISIRYEKLVWQKGEIFSGLPFVHDDFASGNENYDVSGEILNDNKQVVASFDSDFKWTISDVERTFYIKCSVVNTNTGKSDMNAYMFFIIDDNHPFADDSSVRKFAESYLKDKE